MISTGVWADDLRAQQWFFFNYSVKWWHIKQEHDIHCKSCVVKPFVPYISEVWCKIICTEYWNVNCVECVNECGPKLSLKHKIMFFVSPNVFWWIIFRPLHVTVLLIDDRKQEEGRLLMCSKGPWQGLNLWRCNSWQASWPQGHWGSPRKITQNKSIARKFFYFSHYHWFCICEDSSRPCCKILRDFKSTCFWHPQLVSCQDQTVNSWL